MCTISWRSRDSHSCFIYSQQWSQNYLVKTSLISGMYCLTWLTQRRENTQALNHLQSSHQTGSWTVYGNQVQSGSAFASALCLCMPSSVGNLPPTAGSCSSCLTDVTTPASPCCAWFILGSPPTYPDLVIHRLVCLSRPVFSAAIGCSELDEWLKQSWLRFLGGCLIQRRFPCSLVNDPTQQAFISQTGPWL